MVFCHYPSELDSGTPVLEETRDTRVEFVNATRFDALAHGFGNLASQVVSEFSFFRETARLLVGLD